MAEKFVYEETPFVQKNRFRGLEADAFEIPAFSTIKAQLPEPVLADFPEWSALYWRSWEQVWRVGQQPQSENGFLRPFLDSQYNQNMFMWDTAFMSQMAVYGRNAFQLLICPQQLLHVNSMPTASFAANSVSRPGVIILPRLTPIRPAPTLWHGPSGDCSGKREMCPAWLRCFGRSSPTIAGVKATARGPMGFTGRPV